MYNLFLALVLTVASLLPSVGPIENLEKRIESKMVLQSDLPEEKKGESISFKTIPEKVTDFQAISSGSRAALFVDYNSGEILFSKNEEQKLPMASTTKLMTALVVEESLDTNKLITVQPYALRPLDSVMGVPVGTRIKVQELLHGLLIESGSDAAQSLAKEVAGSEQKFVALMNERASFYGLTNTQFTNSVGYDDNGHYSTAKDLIKLARIALLNKNISNIANKKYYTATSEDGQKFSLENTNKLLNGQNYKGLKTGTTFGAGECLIVLYDDGQRKILGVVLNSPDRFGESRGIIEWTKKNFLWQK
jgi:D-alanyl-D-alanine carboxypeptidase